jgi:TrmH family RNA methyltransferase
VPTRNELKYYSSLINKKFRKSEKKFLVEGIKLIREALNSGFHCEIIFGLKSFFDDTPEYRKEFQKKKVRIEIVTLYELEKLSDTKNPQGIVAVFEQKSSQEKKLSGRIIVALENISDPGNMGTIIRNCDWFGIESILLSPDCSEIYNPKVIRSSAGSIFHLNVCETENFYESISELKKENYNILCADIKGQNIFEYQRPQKMIILFANEANGPTPELLSIVNQRITIPGKGKAESLNVASASAVILYELTR